MRSIAMLLILLPAFRLQAQETDHTINPRSVLKTEQTLASDDMRGQIGRAHV